MNNNERIINGIRAYSHQQQVLLRLIRKHGALTEHKFDEIFRNAGSLQNRSYRTTVDGQTVWKPRRSRLSKHGITGDSFIMGSCGEHDRNWWLDLLQYMQVLGLIDSKSEDGTVIYTLPKKLNKLNNAMRIQ